MRVCVDGQVMVGADISSLFTVKVHDALLPEISVAVNVTVILPAPETELPAAGDCVMVMDPAGVQLSETVANDL